MARTLPQIYEIGRHLDRTRDLTEIFELVKRSVQHTLGHDRSGLMLAYYTPQPREDIQPGAALAFPGNLICLNKTLLEEILTATPDVYPSFAYFALLHEYLRLLGYQEEIDRLHAVQLVCRKNLGAVHPATQMAASLPGALGQKGLAFYGQDHEDAGTLEIAPNFDYSNVTYIQ